MTIARLAGAVRRTFATTTATANGQLKVSAHHRTHLIFGANTDVGKTIVSTGLVQASLAQPAASSHVTHYIKPLQSGGSDQGFVEKHVTATTSNLSTHTLFEWETPASPHVASRRENKPVSDQDVLSRLQSTLVNVQQSPSTTTWIETAGGVLSPSAASPTHTSLSHAGATSWGWTTQGDLYQPLLGQTPVVLVGDGRLGGISATLSAMESLLLRGYDVAALVLLEDPGADEIGSNQAALREYASRAAGWRSGAGEALLRNVDQAIVSLPPIPADPAEPLFEWFASSIVQERFGQLNDHLYQSWQGQVADLKALRSDGRDVVWWPFTQHGNVETDDKVTLIDSASGDDFHVLMDDRDESGAPTGDLVKSSMFDACASWWTQGLGHGNSSLALAAAAAAGRYGHVIFPDVVHAPAVSLSHKLVGPQGPGHGWASRVFFTDDGSTGMEVAIKMGMKTYMKRKGEEENKELEFVVCGQTDCYHGDTLGVMDVAEPSIFNEGQHPWYEPKGLFLPTPTVGYQDGKVKVSLPEDFEVTPDTPLEFESIQHALDIDARLLSRKLYSQYRELIEMQWLVFEHSSVNKKIASVVIEPVLLGAGGMKFIDPLWQRALMDVAETFNVPVIFDEVAAGLHRVGVTSCREILRKDPDVACYAKLLTGGLLPMSVTLASEEVFETFWGDEKGQALLHGHSYTGNPVGCVVALQALETYEALPPVEQGTAPRMSFDEALAQKISLLPSVERCFTVGTVLSVTIQPPDGAGGYAASSTTIPIVKKLRSQGIYARPLGNVIYIMASPLTSKEDCARVGETLYETIATH